MVCSQIMFYAREDQADEMECKNEVSVEMKLSLLIKIATALTLHIRTPYVITIIIQKNF